MRPYQIHEFTRPHDENDSGLGAMIGLCIVIVVLMALGFLLDWAFTRERPVAVQKVAAALHVVDTEALAGMPPQRR